MTASSPTAPDPGFDGFLEWMYADGTVPVPSYLAKYMVETAPRRPGAPGIGVDGSADGPPPSDPGVPPPLPALAPRQGEKLTRWVASFRELDPRRQILDFFNDLAWEGVESFESNDCDVRSSVSVRSSSGSTRSMLVNAFDKCGIFSVWRPTSADAIRKMMTGEGTGKGLDIKGKSAKRGEYSGFVPFLQIHDNAHKTEVASMRSDQRVRVFYPHKSSRDVAAARLAAMGGIVSKGAPATVRDIDDYAAAAGVYGLDLPEKLLWEGYVVPHDITREEKYATGRPSIPAFQQMNIDTLREGGDAGEESGCRPVLWHGGCGRRGEDAPAHGDPLCPIGLLMAYEENDTVTPVVSDFDCFLLGTRGVGIKEPLADRDLAMLSWCLDEIEGVLAAPTPGASWTTRWLEVKKRNADHPAHQGMPVFGYADPRSYAIMTGAVRKLKVNGAVRHGPECFNYGFPQELDEEFLVISDTFNGVPWRYTNAAGLIDILCEKIDQGFTFPLNPKWILCDPGWRRVYGKLMTSNMPNVEGSLSVWYPDAIRHRIEAISARYPDGFVDTSDPSNQSSGVQADLALLELKRYKLGRAARKKIEFVGKLRASMIR